MMSAFRLVLVAAAIAVAAQAWAADPRHPDWPCVQIKVPELSVTSMWTGPPIDNIGNAWESDPKLKSLVERLAARRVPIEDAQKAVAETLVGAPSERQEKAKLLFAGLFDTLNRQRSEVMNGIERFTRRQREFADRIRTENLQLRQLEDAADHDQARIDELSNRLTWDTRIFEDRQRTVRFVCEVPTLIEQRLFALSRAIQQNLE